MFFRNGRFKNEWSNKVIKNDNWYHYNNMVDLGEGTDFLKFLDAFEKQAIYYDPGIKMENANTLKPKIKKRSQFRVKYRNLNELYSNWESVDVSANK